jgi:hypothetical protein
MSQLPSNRENSGAVDEILEHFISVASFNRRYCRTPDAMTDGTVEGDVGVGN